MPKCDFEIALGHRCSPIDLLHTFGTTFPKNTSRRLLLRKAIFYKLWCDLDIHI